MKTRMNARRRGTLGIVLVYASLPLSAMYGATQRGGFLVLALCLVIGGLAQMLEAENSAVAEALEELEEKE